jgi:hypothetical protein
VRVKSPSGGLDGLLQNIADTRGVYSTFIAVVGPPQFLSIPCGHGPGGVVPRESRFTDTPWPSPRPLEQRRTNGGKRH